VVRATRVVRARKDKEIRVTRDKTKVTKDRIRDKTKDKIRVTRDKIADKIKVARVVDKDKDQWVVARAAETRVEMKEEADKIRVVIRDDYNSGNFFYRSDRQRI
jgi:hypothetical protein